MRIVVCAKQVPDTNEVRIDPVRNTLIRDGVPSILNPDDASALEAALRYKDEHPETTISVLSMGPPQANYMLRECLAMGADEAYLLSSRAFGGADTIATSTTLAAGVRAIGDYGIIFAGLQALDGDTGQVGPQLAQRLGLPVVTYVMRIRSLTEKTAVVERQLEDGYEVIEVELPCVLTVVKEFGDPRYMSVGSIFKAYEKNITVLDEKAVNLGPSECGLKASPTQVVRSFTPPQKGKGEVLNAQPAALAKEFVDRLQKKQLI